MIVTERKLLGTGSGSMMITLPKWWILANHLKRDDILCISLDDGSLKLEPKKSKEEVRGG